MTVAPLASADPSRCLTLGRNPTVRLRCLRPLIYPSRPFLGFRRLSFVSKKRQLQVDFQGRWVLFLFKDQGDYNKRLRNRDQAYVVLFVHDLHEVNRPVEGGCQ